MEEPATTSVGFRALRMGCHCAATSGLHVARQLVTETWTPAQNGQPEPRVRLQTRCSHTWSGPSLQRHHRRFPEPWRISAGSMSRSLYSRSSCAQSSG